MADVFTRRCGCGNLIGLRESCPRCAAEKRAALHAVGIGTREFVAGKEREAAVNGANLTLRTIVLALGGKPSEETGLVWILKRIEELRCNQKT